MKKLLSAAFLAAGLASPSFGADLPARPYTKSPAMVAPVWSWTGFYAGVNGGYAWGNSDVSIGQPVGFGIAPADVAAIAAAGTQRLRASNFTGGGQLGYNLQFAPNWLLGVETDVQYTGFRKTLSTTIVQPVSGLPANVTENVNSDWLWTLRGRAGYVDGRSLFYATGGLAVANIQFAQTANFNNGASFNSGSVSQTKYGWTAGGGWEYAFASNWSAKIEYLYASLGSVAFVSANTASGARFTHTASLNENLLRIGLNYKFGGPGVAAY